MSSTRRACAVLILLIGQVGLVTAVAAAVPPATTVGASAAVLTDRHTEVVLDRQTSDHTAFRGHLYFASRARGQGVEMFRSDGTPGGTTLLKDVRPGPASSYPTGLTATRNALFFFATGERGRTDLWKSDGTRSGTARVKRGVVIDTYDVEATAVGNILFYFAHEGDKGLSLWRSDGTAAGTFVVERGMRPGWERPAFPDDDRANEMIAAGDRLYVAADGDRHGTELWVSDGTVRGTRLVKDIAVSAHRRLGSDPASLTALDGRVYFTADDRAHGREVWRSNGTGAGTKLVKDILPGGFGDAPSELTAVGDTLFFAAYDYAHGEELWRSDGSAAGTELVANLASDAEERQSSSPHNLTAVGGTLFFSATDGSSAYELWRSDGTAAGTSQLTDLSAACLPGRCPAVSELARAGSSLYFRVLAGSADLPVDELWVSDGTRATTVPIDTFSPLRTWDPAIGSLTSFQGTLVFTARDSIHTRWLLKVADGPAARPTCHGLPATITGSGTITGTPRADVIVGGDGPDTINGLAGNDVICGRGGDDTFRQGDSPDGSDTMNGGTGVDAVDYSSRTSPVRVSLEDWAHPNDGSSTSSDPEFDATISVEAARGGSGDDRLTGSPAPNRLSGGRGKDDLHDSPGDDVALGGAGNDTLHAGYGGDGADLLDGGGGTDTVSYADRYGSLHLTLDAGVGDDGYADEGDTINAIEKAIGGEGDDVITGDDGDDWLEGGYGDDHLTGNGGDDFVKGGEDDDVLTLADGVAGNDRGDGGRGTDSATADPGDTLTRVP